MTNKKQNINKRNLKKKKLKKNKPADWVGCFPYITEESKSFDPLRNHHNGLPIVRLQDRPNFKLLQKIMA